MNDLKIAPSLLAADPKQLEKAVEDIHKAGADYLHIDVMDGKFVPVETEFNKISVIKNLKKYSSKVFDVHLMVDDPDKCIPKFAKAGADIITVHTESPGIKHLHRTLQSIKSLDKKAGLALNPATIEENIKYILDTVDMILVMSVNPGYGGQKFITSQLKKIESIRNIIEKENLNIDIEVDGGINAVIGKQCIDAGANVLVAGSYVFKGGPEKYAENIQSLR